MRIFTKRAFRFDHPSGSPEVQSVYVPDQAFTDVPDWVEDSATFKLAIQDKNELISVIESKKDEIAAETGKSTRKKAQVAEPEQA